MIFTTMMDLMQSVKASKGCQFVSVSYENEQKMNKRNNPYYGRVTKRVVAQMQFGYSYENACNNRCADGVTFVADSLSWGAWVEGLENKVIVHKEEYYLRLYDIHGKRAKVTYFVDGVPATEEQIAEFMVFVPQSKPSAKQLAHGIKEERQVMPKAIKFSNIIEFTINGQTFKM